MFGRDVLILNKVDTFGKAETIGQLVTVTSFFLFFRVISSKKMSLSDVVAETTVVLAQHCFVAENQMCFTEDALKTLRCKVS